MLAELVSAGLLTHLPTYFLWYCCIQTSLLQYFWQTREESFFAAIRTRIHLAALAIKEKWVVTLWQLHCMHRGWSVFDWQLSDLLQCRLARYQLLIVIYSLFTRSCAISCVYIIFYLCTMIRNISTQLAYVQQLADSSLNAVSCSRDISVSFVCLSVLLAGMRRRLRKSYQTHMWRSSGQGQGHVSVCPVHGWSGRSFCLRLLVNVAVSCK